MIVEKSDVVCNKSYYLLIRKNWIGYFNKKSVSVSKISIKKIKNKWALFKVKATNFDENAAIFFLNLGYRLTKNKSKMYPLWPIFSETDNLIHHYDKSIYFLVEGDVYRNIHPSGYLKSMPYGTRKILKVLASGREQLLSLFKARVVDYNYLNYKEYDYKDNPYKVKVTYSNNIEYETGIFNL